MLWSECKALAGGFIHRQDLPFDSLQALALSDINLCLVVQENEAFASGTMSDNGDGLWFYELPDDYATMRSASIGNYILNPVDIKTLQERGNERSWYAISGLKLWTTRSGVGQIVYTVRVPPAGDSNTNAVLDRYPQVYLYAVLKHAAIFAQDYDASQQFEKQFLDGCGTANAIYQNAVFGPGMASVPMGGMI